MSRRSAGLNLQGCVGVPSIKNYEEAGTSMLWESYLSRAVHSEFHWGMAPAGCIRIFLGYERTCLAHKNMTRCLKKLRWPRPPPTCLEKPDSVAPATKKRERTGVAALGPATRFGKTCADHARPCLKQALAPSPTHTSSRGNSLAMLATNGF